jgi:hypothetical protein
MGVRRRMEHEMAFFVTEFAVEPVQVKMLIH